MVIDWYHILIEVGDEPRQEGMVDTNYLSLAEYCLINWKYMPSLVNIRYPVTGLSIWYYWVTMVFPVGYEGSGIPVLKGFMVALVYRIYGLPLSKYPSLTSLGNAAWLNIVDLVVAAPIIPILGCSVVYFCSSL